MSAAGGTAIPVSASTTGTAAAAEAVALPNAADAAPLAVTARNDPVVPPRPASLAALALPAGEHLFSDRPYAAPTSAAFEQARTAYEASLLAADRAQQIERRLMREERELLLQRLAHMEGELAKMQMRLDIAETVHQRTILETRKIVDETLARKRREDSFGRKLLEFRSPDDTGVLGIAFSRDGAIAAAQADGDVALFDQGRLVSLLKGHAAAVNAVSFSAQGLRLASGSKDKTVALWDASTGARLQSFAHHAGDVRSVEFSHDGQFVASGSWDRTACVLDAVTGQKVTGFVCKATVEQAVWHPDRKRIAVAADKSIELFDVTSGQRVATLTGHTGRVNCVSFSPDGLRVASAGDDNTVVVWASSTKRFATLVGHKDAVRSLAYSPDGAQLITGSSDHTAVVWSPAEKRHVCTIQAHQDVVTCVRVASDGAKLATASLDGSIAVFGL